MYDLNQLHDKLCPICGKSLELDDSQIKYLTGADVYHFDCAFNNINKKKEN